MSKENLTVTDDEIREFIHRVPMCKDCKWRRTDITGAKFANCVHPLVVNPGSGEGSFCSIQRGYDSTPCGKIGWLFEPKERWSLRIKWGITTWALLFILIVGLLVWGGTATSQGR